MSAMNARCLLAIVVIALSAVSCNHDETVPAKALRLIEAYPEQNLTYKNNKIVFPDGKSFVFDDGKSKDFRQMLDHPDLEDMFACEYDTVSAPSYLSDPGRSRCDAFFKKMYGSSAKEVGSHLVNVSWFGQEVTFSSVNGADKQLKKVEEELSLLHPQLRDLLSCNGTFVWRKVSGTRRMSAHSFGTAIDIDPTLSDYWLWDHEGASETEEIDHKNRIPLEIVHVFEKHGFVWGGRWYHYDTMHFEYRPEINPGHRP